MELNGLRYVVVGSGFWGAVIAERIATVRGERVLVLEKRPHIGGNSFSRIHPETGVECHLYGTHIFHTVNKEVWDYVHRFSDFSNYQHKVLTQYKGRVYSMPISLATINAYYGLNLKPYEVPAFIQAEVAKSGIQQPRNLEEKAISLIGQPLYEAFIKGYTTKQWETDPRELPEGIITRLPVRHNYNTNYFNDAYQGLPRDGYFKLFERMLNHPLIEVRTGTDFYEVKDRIPADCRIFFSGPIDRLFDYRFGKLEWRTLRFEEEVHPVADYQGISVMNYADLDVPFTRIHEFKHLHPEREHPIPKTVIYKEYSKSVKDGGEPYYPINNEANTQLFNLYQKEAEKQPNLVVGGRLGSYKYWDMDKAIENALGTAKRLG